ALEADYGKFTALDAEILAISDDSIESHCAFAEKMGGFRSFPHLSDTDNQAIRAYRVLHDRGTGARRALFVIDREGKIQHVNRAYQQGDEPQYQALFDTLNRIK